MLLPSDVARLVLGYLQQEGLSATSRAFIHESPNLREYAEHSSEDGVIPACVFSLFGKNLTTILNEYIAVKAKETCQENQIPAMMTSLWKKLDFTLNQIKSMQNSPAVQQIQRLRTQNSIQNMRRQRALASPQPPGAGYLTVASPVHCVASPVAAPQGMLLRASSTPLCYTTQPTRASTINLSQPGDSTLQIIVPDHRIAPGPLSPARRKCDSPRRRGGTLYGTTRGTAVSSNLTVESHSPEAMTENLSQMVIENARERILNDRSLQEKLAENINKILASEISPQASKASCSTVEQEQSIDEILGLQGEIHMTDDAIQDILQQTESDPAFQALFDLFDCGKSKASEGGEAADGSLSNGAQESDEPEPCDSATDTGTGQEDSTTGRETSTRKLRSRSLQEAKSKRKSAVPLGAGQLPRAAAPSRAATKRSTAARGSAQTRVTVGSKEGRGPTSHSRARSKNKPAQNASSASLPDQQEIMEVDDIPSEMSEALDAQIMSQAVDQERPQTEVNTEKTRENIPGSDEPTPHVGVDDSGSVSGAEGRTAEMAGEQAAEVARLFEANGRATGEPSFYGSPRKTDMSNEMAWQQPVANNIPLLDMCAQEVGCVSKEAQSSCSGSVSSELSVSVTHGPTAVSALSAAVSSPITAVSAPSAAVSSPITAVSAPSAAVSSPITAVSAPSEAVPSPITAVSAPSAAVSSPITAVSAPSAAVPSPITAVSAPSATVPSPITAVSAPSAAVSPSSDVNIPLIAVPASLAAVSTPLAAVAAPLAIVPAPSSTVSSPLATISTNSSTTSVSQPQTTEPDLSKIVALKIIISDDQEEQASDSALSQAVSSITGDRIPTIFLSSPGKSPHKVPPTPLSSISPEETAQAVSNLQGAEAPGTPGACLQLSHARPAGQETSFIQLLPASPAFAGASSYFVVTDPVATGDQPSSMMLLSGGSAAQGTACTTRVVATPPCSQAVVSMTTNVSQSFSPASSIIISSPVQPMLQNMAVTLLPSQMLALPGPTLVNQPVKTMSKPKLMPKDNVELGKTGISGSSQPLLICQGSEQLKSTTDGSPSHRRILCFDENTAQTRTMARPSPVAASVGAKQRSRTLRPQPCVLDPSTAKRRVDTVRLPEPGRTSLPKEPGKGSTQTEKQKETPAVPQKDGHVGVSADSATKQDASIRPETKRRSASSSSTETTAATSPEAGQSQDPRSSPVGVVTDGAVEEPHERRASETPQGASESSSSQDSPGVTANKENEAEGGRREPHQPAAENFGSSATRPPVSLGKTCKTSPLTKQAVEMLQDIQSLSPTSTPSRRKAAGCLDLPLPRTPGPGRMQEDSLDGLRTPSRQRQGRGAEGTPKHLPPPATPDLPSCSPASEAGSENSINMAAHTLMILSRAARTGGPLKDSLRQEEAGAAKSSASSGKKRKHAELSPTDKKELQLAVPAGNKKKSQKRKKLLDSFPRDLDVDKFLSSLHYDE